ncbi:hypothetical protein QVD99_003421 [Batrachochytrium dendrobatidis]|nr:hypothetical protein O5D80_005075 [Batrachochytrium dendrobatidis]KAK5670100.1 hypothetical protein QVD99_003421 [Batrachochytrium dendrobatidis]
MEPGRIALPITDNFMAKAVYDQDPELETLVQEFAQRMASQQQNEQLMHEQRKGKDYMDVDALPGFVFKTKTLEATDDYPLDMKVFVNICHSSEIPQPPPISDEELKNVVANMDSSSYRIPLSLSSPRSDIDKGGHVCIVFDVCVNSAPFARTRKDEYFCSFLVLMAIAWIEQKHKLKLSEDFSFPKMRTKGKLVRHTVRKYRKPFISEMESSKSNDEESNSLSTDPSSLTALSPIKTTKTVNKTATKDTANVPIHTFIFEPAVGHPEYIVIQVQLPLLETISKSELDIESDRLIFADGSKYKLDIPLPFSVDIDEAGAQFNRHTRILSITTSVLPIITSKNSTQA